MKLSKYNVFVPNYPTADEHLVFNTRSQALVKIDQELKSLLDNLSTVTKEKAGRYDKDFHSLYQMGIIVKDEADDEERFLRFIDQRKYGIDHSLFLASILTTYNCNFACTYCFEESTRTSSQKLDKPTADLIMEWLKKKVKRLQIQNLIINYYGGEPLLNEPIMEYISTCMQSWCREMGVGFKVYIQTNGFLLTPEFIEKHKKLGLTNARISVDGTKELHDRQRITRGSGAGTFDVVMQNLTYAVDHIKIGIAAGYDEGNPECVLNLLDYLEEVDVLRKLDSFIHTPVHPTLGPKGHAENIVGSECLNNYKTETLLNAGKILKEAMQKKGFPVKSGLSTSMCPVTRENGGVTIDTNGLIFKCNSMLGHPELAVGNVRHDEYNQKQREFMTSEAWKECGSDCAYAPLCNTGCRLFGFFKTKSFMAKSCEREYMDQFVPNAIKKEYEMRKATQQNTAKEALV